MPASIPLRALTPSQKYAPELLMQAQGIRAVIFDVDGVLTDGGIYFSELGETLKRFNSLDGYGIRQLQQAGITVAIITGRDSLPLRKRLSALGIAHTRYGVENKLPAAQALLTELELEWQDVAVMGDDWPDLPLMQRAALCMAPANAHAQVKTIADAVTQAAGGHGAARELCDLVLCATGAYARLLASLESTSLSQNQPPAAGQDRQ